MDLNCKPGDLARVISNEETRRLRIVDKIITVTKLADVGDNPPAWEFEGGPFYCPCGCGRECIALADYVLRPIRNPGADEEDEMIKRAGKAPKTRDHLEPA